jgi:ABC-type nitrate/sulfonate/bicarbonate transport system substrate-binding protein/outer membrane protein OmpA-like peptidoglycan-associated protein
MRKFFVLAVSMMLLFGISGLAEAKKSAKKVQFIDVKPLSQVVDARVGECGGKATQAFVITWGGDIATIVAQGNQKSTAAGSIFAQQGLNLTLKREDDFTKQVSSYLKCESPYLRGTLGMINMAADVTEKDSRTKMQTIYQHTWSAGGDAMVVKGGIKNAKNLKGKTIALQAYGVHVDYLSRILSDAGLTMRDVKLRWTKDLTGTDNTPMKAFYEPDVDAAMVISPDAMALTSGGKIGDGSEDSVKGAKILLSTKTANRIIADVYAVRSDYFASHREEVAKFVHGLMLADEATANLFKNKKAQPGQYNQMISAAASILLDSPQATADAEGLYGDCEYVGWKGNVKFFGDKNYPRNFEHLNGEIQKSFTALGIMRSKVVLSHAKWDYNSFKSGLHNTAGVDAPKFDAEKVAQLVTKKQKLGKFEEDEFLPSFEIYFKPNQDDFSDSQYADEFRHVIDRASTYGGAVITIEGHADPLHYLKKKKQGASQVELNQIKQGVKNLSLARANAVRASIIRFAKSKGVALDVSQFVVVGQGISNPKSGLCGGDPCPPKTEQEWLSNMRVEFKMIQVEAETNVFEKIN